MNSFDDVAKFMYASDQNQNDFGAQANLYMSLVIEEYKELMVAFGNRDMVEIADACADLKWVIEGLELTLGIPQQAVWNEVARSNHAKIGADGKVQKRADGKVQKPEGWTPPDIKSILKK
jgi:predicted HAD superfamily Cof-like phosphohydrolase